MDDLAILPGHGVATESAPAVDATTVPPQTAGVVGAEHITPEHVASTDPARDALAARLRGKLKQLQNRRHTFPVPPDDVWGNDLQVRVKPVAPKEGQPFAALIAEATVAVLIRNEETRQLEEVPGAWAGVGELMGITGEKVTVGQIITQVCSSAEVVAVLGTQVLGFIAGKSSALEQALGE